MSLKGIGFYNEEFLLIKQNIELLKEDITRLLLTVPGEAVGNSNWGCYLKSYIFEFDFVLLEEVEQEITRAINTWEPRVNILNVDIYKDESVPHIIHVNLLLQSVESLEEFNLSLEVTS